MSYCEVGISVKLNVTLDEGDFDSLSDRLDSASFCARTSLESNFMAYDSIVEVSVAVEKATTYYTIKATTYYTIKAKNLNLSYEDQQSLVRLSFVDQNDIYYDEFLVVEVVNQI